MSHAGRCLSEASEKRWWDEAAFDWSVDMKSNSASLIKQLISDEIALIRVSKPKTNTLNNYIAVFIHSCDFWTLNACITVVRNRLTHVVFHKVVYAMTFIRGGWNSCHCSAASSFKYLCARNYQNRTWFDSYWKKRVQLLPHSAVDERPETGRELDQHITDTLLWRPRRYPPLYRCYQPPEWQHQRQQQYHHHHHHFWLAPLRLRSATRSQQSPELSALSRVFSRPKQAYPAFSRNNTEKLCIIMADDV